MSMLQWMLSMFLAGAVGGCLVYVQQHHQILQLRKQIDQLISERYFTRGEVDTLAHNLDSLQRLVSSQEYIPAQGLKFTVNRYSVGLGAFTPHPTILFSQVTYSGNYEKLNVLLGESRMRFPDTNTIQFAPADVVHFGQKTDLELKPFHVSIDSLLESTPGFDPLVYRAQPEQAYRVIPQLGRIGSWEYWLVVLYHVGRRFPVRLDGDWWYVPIVFRFTEPARRSHLSNWNGDLRDVVVLQATKDFSPHNFSFHPNFTLYTNGYSGTQLISSFTD